LCQVLGAVIEAGATTINIPDTVGYNTPEEFGSLIRHLIENTVGARRVVWSTHCHNDLGLATANTLSGVVNGARQVEVTVNGIGERAGNTAMEEVVMAIYTHPSYYPVHTAIETGRIYKISQLIAQKTGMIVQPNKAIVGANAFAHESGIHQDGVLKCEQTYEIIQPSVVGVPKSLLVLGKHSGRNAFRSRLSELGYDELAEDQTRFEKLFHRFKAVADAKNRLMDSDLVALIEDELGHAAVESYSVKFIQVVSNVIESAVSNQSMGSTDDLPGLLSSSLASLTSEYSSTATATVSLINHRDNNTELSDAAIGRGPVDAIFKCINRLVGLSEDTLLVQYEVKSVTEGRDALGRVHVRLCKSAAVKDVRVDCEGSFGKQNRSAHGRGTHWDILTASAIAYVDAVNRLLIINY
jgi:2-isopropylmalate synthase